MTYPDESMLTRAANSNMLVLTTPRLRLRPLRPADAPRMQEICGNWNVARMLERVPHPFPDGLADKWIAEEVAGVYAGVEYNFVMEFEGEMVGLVRIARQGDGAHMLGYWLDESWWGQGLASEAVVRIIRFAREQLGLDELVSSYFADNFASARIQQRCGFAIVGSGRAHNPARGGEVDMIYTRLRLNDAC